MEKSVMPFVQRAVVAFGRGDRKSVENPTWDDIEEMLRSGLQRPCRLELSNESESEAMTIFSEGGAWHITISVDETDYYFSWDGSESTNRGRDIFGHTFEENQVLKDFITVRDAVRVFWETGGRPMGTRWLHETIEV